MKQKKKQKAKKEPKGKAGKEGKARKARKPGKEENETMRKSAARLKKDLDEFMALVEKEGSQLPPGELQGFEDRQFQHITSKIADAIIARIGEDKFKQISEQLKNSEITLHEAATGANLKMGDLFIILEARKVFTEEQLRKKLSENRRGNTGKEDRKT